MNEQSSPVPSKRPKATLKDLLEGQAFRTEVSKALPSGSPDAFIRAALTAAIRNPMLYKVRPDSLWQCLFDLAQMGLYPDGRRAHLVPFGEQCQLIVDYKGIAELARKNGDVAYIHCDVVHQGEHYVCQYGTDGRLEHIPSAELEDQPVVCAYSFVKIMVPGSNPPVLVEEYTQMSSAAVERVRLRSKAAKTGPWVTDWDEMAKKTVFRRHSKTLALSPGTRRALEYGEEEELSGFRNAVPAIVPKRTKSDVIDAEPEDIPEAPIPPEPPKPPIPPEPPEPPKAPKRTRQAKEPEKPAENTVDMEQPNESGLAYEQEQAKHHQPAEPKKATKAEPQSLFQDEQREELVNKLKTAGLKFSEFAEWLNAIGAVSSTPAKVEDLRSELVIQAVDNWDANLVALRSWKQEREQQNPF